MKKYLKLVITLSSVFLYSILFSQPTTWIHQENSNLPTNAIGCIAVDEDNNKWIGTTDNFIEQAQGLVLIDELDEMTVFNRNNSILPSNNITSVFVDSGNNKWVGTSTGAILHIDAERNMSLIDSLDFEALTVPIVDICEDQLGNIYLAAQGKGLIEYQPDIDTWRLFDQTNTGLELTEISCLEVDSRNHKWIGVYSDDNSLFRWDGINDFELIIPINAVSPTYLRTLGIVDGELWIGSDNAIRYSYLNVLNLQDLSLAEKHTDQARIFDIHEADDGDIWVGYGPVLFDPFHCSYCGNGLKILDQNDSLTQYVVPNTGLGTRSRVTSITADKNGNTWIGTWNGIIVIGEAIILGAPTALELGAMINYFPNPCQEVMIVEFEIAKAAEVDLLVYDQLGSLVKTMRKNRSLGPGKHQFTLTLEDSLFQNGLYYLQLEIDDAKSTYQFIKTD